MKIKVQLTLRLCAISFLVVFTAIIYVAYFYAPTEYQTESAYLKTISSEFVTTSNFNIHFTHSGSGAPLILIHGGGTWLYSFRANIPALAEHYSVYALDMPGHGYTQIKNNDARYDLDMMAQVLLEFMQTQGLEKVSLVGHSWGGGWALYFAEKYPDRVEKLALIDSGGLDIPDKLEWQLLKYPIIGEFISKVITDADVRRGLEDAFFNKALVTTEMVDEIKVPLSFSDNRRAQYLLERNLNWKKTEQNLSHIAMPILIIWGANDQYLSVNAALQFKELIPQAEIQILENCGHSAHEEYPQEVNQMIINFIDSK